MTAPGEEREAFWLLRRLAGSGGTARIGDGGIVPASRQGARGSAIAGGAEGPLVQSLLRRGLIEQSADGSLTLLNTVRSGGAGPTYVSIHPAGRHLLVANYFGGSIAVLPIKSDGQLGEPTDVKVDDGPIGPRQAQHAPPGSFAFSGHDRTQY